MCCAVLLHTTLVPWDRQQTCARVRDVLIQEPCRECKAKKGGKAMLLLLVWQVCQFKQQQKAVAVRSTSTAVLVLIKLGVNLLVSLWALP